MPVTHNVGCQILVAIVSLAQTTVLVDITNNRTRSDVGVGIGGVVVIAQTARNTPPVGDVKCCMQGASETVLLVIHAVLVDDPVGVLHIASKLPNTVKQTILGAVLIQVMSHFLIEGPSIQGVHGTRTATVPQTTRGEGLVGLGNRVGHIGANGQATILLLAIEANGGLVIARLGDDTLLVEVRHRQEESAVLGTTAHAQVVVQDDTILEEVTDVVIDGLSSSKGLTP